MTKIQQQSWLQQNWPLKSRALFLALLLSLSASLIIGLPITRASVEQLELQSVQLRNTLSKQVSIQASEAIFSQDLLSLNVILDTLVKDPLIRYGAIYTLNNEVIAEQGVADTVQGQPLSILYQNEVIGLLEIRLDHSGLDHSTHRLYGLWLILSSLLCIIGSLMGWFAGRYIGRKIEQTQSQIHTLGKSNSEIRIHRIGELNPLSQALAKHHQQLQGQAAMSQALSQFIGTADNTNEASPSQGDDHAEHSNAAVLFINPMNLEKAQAQLTTLGLAALLNEYYGLINQAAALYNGHVDRYMGKGALVLFGLPHEDEKDCFHGVCMALLLIGLLHHLNQSRHAQGLAVIDFQLGLHAGTVLSNTYNDQIQVTQMSMCDTLHIAGRLSRKGQANRLLISEDVIKHGELASQLILNKSEIIKGQSSEDSIQSFWVEHLTPNYQALIDRQVQHICHQTAGIQA
jgi:class 3 adenylate cyclase/uncharacterized membrane protein affecting hemolysin expression